MGHALPSTVEEQDILASCRDGTEDAFEMLYRRYAAPLREFCRGRLGDPSEAEDACHETLLKASTAVDRFDDARPLWPWLATIAANVCLGLQRAQSRDVIGIGKGIEARIEPARDPHAEVTSRVCTQLVGEAIRDLPDRYRARVYLRELEGWTYRQIADLEHTTVAAIRSSLARGRKALETRIRLAAESNPLWPLPAFVPFGWLRRVPWLRRTTDAAGGPEYITTFQALAPNALNALVVMLSVASFSVALDTGQVVIAEQHPAPATVASTSAWPNADDGLPGSIAGSDSRPETAGSSAQTTDADDRQATPRQPVDNDVRLKPTGDDGGERGAFLGIGWDCDDGVREAVCDVQDHAEDHADELLDGTGL